MRTLARLPARHVNAGDEAQFAAPVASYQPVRVDSRFIEHSEALVRIEGKLTAHASVEHVESVST